MAKHYLEFPDGLVVVADNPTLFSSAKRLPAAEGKRKKREYAKARLLEILYAGDTVYTVLRHVSSSGVSRRVDLYAIKPNGKGACEPVCLSGYAADVLDWPLAKQGGVSVSGCGMDMGFHTVHSLASCLFEHRPDDKDSGGYALKHKWL